MVFLYPYIIIFNKSQANTIPVNEKYLEANEIYLHNKMKKNEKTDGIKVYYAGWKGGLLFYKYKFAENNKTIHLTDNIEFIQTNDIVLVCNDSLKKVLSDTYTLVSLDSCLNATLYLTTPKNHCDAFQSTINKSAEIPSAKSFPLSVRTKK
ncbi:MAG: hypothetical protein BWY70_00939 [Bacteroidetes bacterium ADurb.Bin408]|nr:MAG: hypothetical protein BWY70_00939 [Bacteroidetes bacterium ADurb.Bin408]